eukprot:TRINITY_DN13463_c0_g1_i4.p1 TRINITY_DN13463_c0_g1~~TRINITY_DN13463_c0_g1_i4.p1  ORF type:complete len:762 (-),score=332.33 TRINITY_DN13463_c0_g1_i4:1614-3833(-)
MKALPYCATTAALLAATAHGFVTEPALLHRHQHRSTCLQLRADRFASVSLRGPEGERYLALGTRGGRGRSWVQHGGSSASQQSATWLWSSSSSSAASAEPAGAATSSQARTLASQLHQALSKWEAENEDGRLRAAVDSAFTPADLPPDVLAAAAAAPEAVRLEAYTLLLATCASRKHYLNLFEARVTRKAAATLCPLRGQEGGPLPGAAPVVAPEAITQANKAAARLVAAALPNTVSDEERADTGGWLLFLMDFMANRLPASQHVATDEEAVGVFFDLLTEEEKQEIKDKKSAKMFSDAVGSFLPPKHLAQRLDAQAWAARLNEIARGIRAANVEVKPSREDAIFWLRVKARTCVADMIRRSAALLDAERGLTTATVPETLDSAQLLDASLELARLCLENIIVLDGGYKRATAELYAQATEEHLMGLASDFNKATPLYMKFLEGFVRESLEGKRPLDTTAKFDALLLRRMLSMTGSLAKNLAIRAYAEQLGAVLQRSAEAAASAAAKGEAGPIAQCLDDLDDALELPRDLRMDVRLAALEVYMQQYVGAKGEAYAPDEAGRWVCGFLGVPESKLEGVLQRERGKAFAQALEPVLRPQGKWRYEPLSEGELGEVTAAAERAGLTQEAALDGAARELRPLLQSLIQTGADLMRREQAEAGRRTVEQLDSVLSGLAAQLLGALGGDGARAEDALMRRLSLKGDLTEVQEFWMSELCWALIDEDAEGDEGDPANRVLDLMGIK